MRRSKILFSLLLISSIVNSVTGNSPECSGIKDVEKFDCYPEAGANQQTCTKRGCCWSPRQESSRPSHEPFPPLDVPWCYYPKNYRGYEYVNLTTTEQGSVAYLRLTNDSPPPPYPNVATELKMEVVYYDNNVVRVKMSDAQHSRYESAYPHIPNISISSSPKYRVDINMKESGFKVARTDGDVLFDCQSTHGLIFSDQFIQISSKIRGRIYGLGEHRTTFWLDTNWTRYTMFAHDSPPKENVNLYGSHPFYLVVEPNGKSHGVFLRNSNAMDIVLQPLPAITFTVIGGILDFFFFMGPTPGDVIRQYTQIIGRPFLPPYWSLGFHLCKYGYGSDEATRAVWQRTRDAKIPFDVQWNDIDYMHNQNDFTIHPVNFRSLPQLVKDIHDAEMYYVPILDPGVSASEPLGTYPPYDDGIQEDIFVKNDDGTVFIGKVWNPNSTAFPDFTNPKTQAYWTKHIRSLHEKIPFDGLWIDMNEPSNFLDGGFNGCPDNEYDNPPYVPGVDGGKLYYKTICMSAKQYAGRHYDVHNLYGISESDVTMRSLEEVTGKRSFVLSRSTFPGSGKYTAHWTGDNFSTWHDLTKSIPAILSMSLYGIPFAGADICGFIGNTTKSLCNRWMQLGAFYPFSRNHNSLGNADQDPVVFGEDVIKNSIKALTIRYSLLPYLYTLFYKAHIDGDTVARPLFFEFPQDERTHEVDRSFFWGSGLYIVPVTEDKSQEVKTYLPAGKWYDWYTLQERDSKGEDVTLQAHDDVIPLLIRGGNVLPTQTPGLTTSQSRRNGFTYIVAPDNKGAAKGDLFWDDGISLDTIKNKQYGILSFTLTERNFTSKVELWNVTETPNLETIQILGVKNVTKVLLNGKETKYAVTSSVLTIPDINIPLNIDIQMNWI